MILFVYLFPASKQLTLTNCKLRKIKTGNANENNNDRKKFTDTLRVKVQWVSASDINFLMPLSYKILLSWGWFPFRHYSPLVFFMTMIA